MPVKAQLIPHSFPAIHESAIPYDYVSNSVQYLFLNQKHAQDVNWKRMITKSRLGRLTFHTLQLFSTQTSSRGPFQPQPFCDPQSSYDFSLQHNWSFCIYTSSQARNDKTNRKNFYRVSVYVSNTAASLQWETLKMKMHSCVTCVLRYLCIFLTKNITFRVKTFPLWSQVMLQAKITC